MSPDVCSCTNATCLEATVPRSRSAFPITVLAAILFCLAPAGSASDPASSAPTVEFLYHSLIPLGNEAFTVQPWNSVLTVLASAENPEFEGWRRESVGDRHRVVDAAGRTVRLFPEHLDFRVTLGTRTRLADDLPFTVRTAMSENDYLLSVRFRLKVFHGLRQKVVPASSVVLIGVPADLPYNERIYRVSFDVDDIPMSDRIVLEVLSPGGDRLCKFHLDLL